MLYVSTSPCAFPLCPQVLLSLSLWSTCGWKSLHLFFNRQPQSAASRTEVHKRASPLFPSAILFTWPLKHIKSPAGDRETVNRYLHFFCSHHQPPLTPPPFLEGRYRERAEGSVATVPPFGLIEIIFHSWKPCQKMLCLGNKSSSHFTNGHGKHII